ncbi:MAG: ABC-2 transporter permease [Clostridium sp.]
MNSVISLIKQNILTIIGLKRNLLIIVMFSFLYPLLFPDLLLFTSVIIPYTLLINLFSMEEKNKSQYLISTLPIKKESYVVAKYLLAGAIIIVNVLVSLFMNYILSMGIGMNNPKGYEPIFILIVGIMFPVVLVSIGVPILIKIGAVKGQIIMLVSVGAICGVVGGVLGASGVLSSNVILNLDKITLIILVLGICLILILTSYFISLNIYNKKEVL